MALLSDHVAKIIDFFNLSIAKLVFNTILTFEFLEFVICFTVAKI